MIKENYEIYVKDLTSGEWYVFKNKTNSNTHSIYYNESYPHLGKKIYYSGHEDKFDIEIFEEVNIEDVPESVIKKAENNLD